MSYNKNMFHRIGEELQRIAEEVDVPNGEHMDDDDMFTVLQALGRIVLQCDDRLVATAMDLVVCSFGDMPEVFECLPEVKSELLELLLEDDGYEQLTSDYHVSWLKRW